MKKIKGILGILLSTLVLLSSFPVSVFAVTPEAPTLDNVNIKIQAYDDDKDRNIQSITVSASTFKNKFSDTIVFGSPTESDGQWFCTATLTGYSSTGTEDTHVVNYLIRGTSYNGYTISADETAVKDIRLVYDENKSEWNVAGSDDNTVIYRVSKNGTACIHSLIKVDGKEATCEENGFEAYWQCENCGKLFSDENGENEISAPIEIPASGHSLIKVDGKEATCEENGFEAYWQCENCGKLFSDGNGENEISAPIEIPASGHSLIKVDGKEATCEENGFEAYWKCENCGKLFSDENGKNEISAPIEIPASGHSLIKVDGKEATCEENGFEAYWKCENCGKLFSDENGKNEISAPIEIPASGHSLIKVDGKEATCEENGFEAYWQCENCGKLFSDENGENEIAFPITIPAKGHSYDNGSCTECGAIDSRYKLGDVNLDGYVNIIDATLVQKYLAQISFSDTFSKPHADANNDGIINISDATWIQFIAAEIIDS